MSTSHAVHATESAPSPFSFSISTNFHNKELKPRKSKKHYAAGFTELHDTIIALAAHISAGGAWSPGVFLDDCRKKSNFLFAQAIGIDLDDGPDVETLAQIPFIAKYCAFIGASASSTPEKPKSRLVFILDELIKDLGDYERAVKWLIAKLKELGIFPDEACKDASRFFYGATEKNFQVFAGNILPLEVIQSWEPTIPEPAQPEPVQTEQRANPQPHRQPKPAKLQKSKSPSVDASRAEKYLGAALQNAVDEIMAAAEGTRNNTLFKNATQIASLLAGLSLPEDDTQLRLEDAALQAGLDHNEIATTLDSAWSTGYANPKTPDLNKNNRRSNPKRKYPDQPITLLPFTADEQIDFEYVSDMDLSSISNKRSVLIKSPIGTGKTELIKRLVEQFNQLHGREPRLCLASHLKNLVGNIGHRMDILSYSDLERQYLPSLPQVVTTLNSLHKLNPLDQHYDIVVLDEVEQALRHLGGGTLQGVRGVQAYAYLEAICKNSGQLICLDAYATDSAKAWMTDVIGECHAIENTYTPDRGILHEYKSLEVSVANFLESIRHASEPHVAVTNHKQFGYVLEQVIRDDTDVENILVINSDNSNSEEVQNLINDPDPHLPLYDVVITSPTMGTGIDIQTPVAAVHGFFFNQPLDPTDYMQMMGRFRNAEERHIYVSPHYSTADTDHEVIYNKHVRRMTDTARVADFDEHGIEKLPAIQEKILRLQSRLKADSNYQHQDGRGYTRLLAKDAGYTVTIVEQKLCPVTREKLKEARATVKDARIEATLTESPIDHEQFQEHRQNGTLNWKLRCAHERYKIEEYIGSDIDSEIFEKLGTARKRQALDRFIDLHTSLEQQAARDRQDALDQHQITKRDHSSMKRLIFEEATIRIWGLAGIWSAEKITEAVFRERATAFVKLHLREIKLYIDGRPDLSEDPIRVIRRIFAAICLKLKSRQKMVNGERFMVYAIDAKVRAETIQYAKQRVTHARLDVEIEPQFTTNAKRIISSRVHSNPSEEHPGTGLEPSEVQQSAPPPLKDPDLAQPTA